MAVVTLKEVINKLDDMADQYYKLAKRSAELDADPFAQGFDIGVSNAFFHVSSALKGERKLGESAEERLLKAIFGDPNDPNPLRADDAWIQLHNRVDDRYERDRAKMKEELSKFYSWLKQNEGNDIPDMVEAYIVKYMGEDEVEVDDESGT